MLCFILFACATPAQRFDQAALEIGFNSQFIGSKQFQHKIYQAKGLDKGDVLHVYLDGDGTPWVRNRWIAEDPTARNPLILDLMGLDKTPAILLGRPCYYGLSPMGACDNKYWTSHRYSKAVVDSMVLVLNKWLRQRNYKQIVLIGYSGGGSLAMLMADSVQGVTKVATVAANLNVAAWSNYHGYLMLKGSLNPAVDAETPPEIKQVHIAGQDDDVVPAFIISDYAKNQKNASYYEMEKQDHACCWEDIWFDLLTVIDNE